MEKTPQSIKIIDDENIEVTLSDGKTWGLRCPRAIDANGLSQEALRARITEHVQKLVNRISTPQMSRVYYSQLAGYDTEVISAALSFFYAVGAARTEIMDNLEDLGLLRAVESGPMTSRE